MVRTLDLLSKDFQFYEIEMEDPDLGAPNQQVEEKVWNPQSPGASGGDTLNEPTPMEQDQEEVQLRKSERDPRRRFEIEGKAFMLAPVDEEKDSRRGSRKTC